MTYNSFHLSDYLRSCYFISLNEVTLEIATLIWSPFEVLCQRAETVLRGYTEFSRNDAEFSQNLKLMVEFYVLVI